MVSMKKVIKNDLGIKKTTETHYPKYIRTLNSIWKKAGNNANKVDIPVMDQENKTWQLIEGLEPAMVLVRFEFCLLFRLTDLSPRVIAWLNENSTVAHSNRKTQTAQADISVKKIRELYPES